MRLNKRQPEPGPQENLIPLINIVFLILIFFLVASTLRSFDPDGLSLSEARGDPARDPAPNILIARADGQLTLAGTDIVPDALPARLVILARDHADLPLLIAPDRELPADRLVEIAQTAQSAGIARIRLIVMKPAPDDGAGR
jgi:biopolymer transport protein ExbD